MAKYLIQGETLTAIANKIRVYISKIGDNTHTIDPNVVAEDKTFKENSIKVHYIEDFDSGELSFEDYVKAHYGDIIGFDYIKNAEECTVPVIYFYNEEEEYTEPHFYVGMDIINDEIYDKWRKIELTDGEGGDIGSSTSQHNYTWDSDRKKYVYTNRVVVCSDENDGPMSPVDFPGKIEQVYNAGYEEGVKHGNGSGVPSDSVVGTWVFNDDISTTIDFDLSVDVAFMSNGSIFNKFQIQNTSSSGDCFISYGLKYDGDAYFEQTVYRSATSLWEVVDISFRTITFLSDPLHAEQIGYPADYNYDFLSWLKANAAKIGDGSSSGGGGLPAVYEVATIDDLPTSTIEGSIGIVGG